MFNDLGADRFQRAHWDGENDVLEVGAELEQLDPVGPSPERVRFCLEGGFAVLELVAFGDARPERLARPAFELLHREGCFVALPLQVDLFDVLDRLDLGVVFGEVQVGDPAEEPEVHLALRFRTS